ncbi:MAG: FtsH protease activity modulator HflK [Rhodospirillales bacterium]|jgi:membrane protease subunit HflK
MPWQNQGGPWGGGSNNGGGGGPWGSGGGRGPSGGGRGPQPPDFDEMLRKGQDKLKRLAPRGGDKLMLALLVLIGLGLWLFSGVYRVEADEQGVVTRFGKFVRLETPGLHFHLPYPVEAVQTPKVTRVNKIELGGPNRGEDQASMLTGDSKIVEVDYVVFWKIANAGDYLFQIRNPEQTIAAAAESVMREIIGQNSIDYALTDGREAVAADGLVNLQKLLDEYKAGVTITNMQVLRVDPPGQVIDAFRDVQRAVADKDRFQKQAEAYQRDVVPRARGEAAKLIEEAEAYKREVIARATGDANRFMNVYNSYKVAKDVTQRRIYLETMEEVLRNANKVIVDGDGAAGGSGVVPYLPLPEIQKRRKAAEKTDGGQK